MKRIFAVFIFTLAIVQAAMSTQMDIETGYYLPAEIEPNGDTVSLTTLPQVWIRPNPLETYNSERQRKLFWKLVRDVKRTLPYAKEIAEEVKKVDNATKGMSEKQKDAYMKKAENNLVDKYKPRLSKLTLRQGKILIKLVDRECGETSYELVKQYRGGFRAFFWQGFASMMGASLKTGYNKNEEEVIEYIIDMVEAGRI